MKTLLKPWKVIFFPSSRYWKRLKKSLTSWRPVIGVDSGQDLGVVE